MLQSYWPAGLCAPTTTVPTDQTSFSKKKEVQVHDDIPQTIFCGLYPSVWEEAREEPEPPVSPRASLLLKNIHDSGRVGVENYEVDDDDSTVVSTSGVSVLSIDYDNANHIVEGGEKVDLSDIGDDDESTVASDDGEGGGDYDESALEHDSPSAGLKRDPSYASIDNKQSSASSSRLVKRNYTNLSHSSKFAEVASAQGNTGAESKRKELLKTLKNKISKHGRYSLPVAETLKDLGFFHEACGQDEIAITLYQESLDVYSSKLGDHDENVTDLLVRLGRGTQRLGNENEAMQLFSQALFMIIDLSGDYDITACDIRVDLSKIIQSKGFHKEAVKELKKALRGYREKHGDEHISVAETVGTIADFYTESGNHGKANNVRGELVKLRVALHGSKSSEVAIALEKWASTHGGVGDLSGALRIMKQSYVMFHEIEGPDGANAEETLEKIGFLYSQMGRSEKAIKAHTSVALTRKKRHGEHSVELAASYLILGKAYMEDSKPDRALKALNRAMTCYGKANEVNNEYICELMETLHTIGVLHLKTSENEKALKTFIKEKSIRLKYMNDDKLGLAAALKLIGLAHCELNNFAEGKTILVEVLQLYDKVDGRKLLFADAMNKCGEALEGLNDENRAFICYKECVQIFMANGYDEEHPLMKSAVLKLLAMGLNDVTSLTPALRCSLIDGESAKFEF